MPTSVAATVMRASSPAARPATLTGTVSMDAGFHLLRHVEADVERARRLVDGEPAQAERAARHALGLLVHRPVEHHGDVGAGAPVVADADRDLAAAGRQVGLLRGGEAGVHHGDQRAAGHARGDLDARRVARPVGRLVERDVEHLGAVGGLVGPVAGVEHRAGDRGRCRRADLEAIAAPVDLGLDLGGRAGRGVGRAGGDAARAGLRTRSSTSRRGCTTASAGRGAAAPTSGPWPRRPCRRPRARWPRSARARPPRPGRP